MTTEQEVRRQFVEVGVRLLGTGQDLATLNSDALAAAGAPGKYLFAKAFLDRDDYLFEVLTGLLDQVRQEASDATRDLPPGIGRMQKAAEAFLDSALRHSALHELVLALRRDPRRDTVVSNRNCATVLVFQLELEQIGVARAQGWAMLVYGKLQRIARAECAAHRALPELREALYAFIGSLQS